MTTQKELEAALKTLNDTSTRKYNIDYANGGVRLVAEEQGTGVSDISYRMPKSQLYAVIISTQNYKSAEKHQPR